MKLMKMMLIMPRSVFTHIMCPFKHARSMSQLVRSSNIKVHWFTDSFLKNLKESLYSGIVAESLLPQIPVFRPDIKLAAFPMVLIFLTKYSTSGRRNCAFVAFENLQYFRVELFDHVTGIRRVAFVCNGCCYYPGPATNLQ